MTHIMDHYKKKNKESIEIIRDSLSDEEFKGFLLGNVYKYINRHEYKGNPSSDIRKAVHYLQALEVMIEDPECRNPFAELATRQPKSMSPETKIFSKPSVA